MVRKYYYLHPLTYKDAGDAGRETSPGPRHVEMYGLLPRPSPLTPQPRARTTKGPYFT